MDLIEGSRVHNPSPPFRDITDAVGFHFNRSDVNGDLRQDIIDTRSSLIDSGLSVVDWNHDGFWDLLVTESMNHSLLFRNDGPAALRAGTADGVALRGACGGCDGRGDCRGRRAS